jgi:hypothetical protein
MDPKDGRAHRAARRAQRSFQAQASNVTSNNSTDQHVDGTANEEEIDEDDLCPICQLLLHEPVTTTCRHTLCNFCMATWASTSLAAPMTIVDVDEEPAYFDAVSVEARCPMCRTLTSAVADGPRAEVLRTKYPLTCRDRDLEAAAENGAADSSESSLQTLTVYIGNRHTLVPSRANDLAQNQHEWTFFVRPSRTDIIEAVHIHLHPTFRDNHIVKRRAPYEISRLGWGHFVIAASVVLKAGYSWVSEDAFDSPEDGHGKGALQLEWTLDFEGFGGKGSMGRSRLKVRDERAERGARKRRVVGQVG